MEFADLIGACALFVSTIGRVMPALRGHAFTDDERDALAANLGRGRATADWVEHAASIGNLSLMQGGGEIGRLRPWWRIQSGSRVRPAGTGRRSNRIRSRLPPPHFAPGLDLQSTASWNETRSGMANRSARHLMPLSTT